MLRAEAAETSSATSSISMATSKRPAVLADGTYATQSAVADTPVFVSTNSAVPNLRALLLGGDFFLGGVVAGTLVKMLLRYKSLPGMQAATIHRLTAEAMLYIVSILRLGETNGAATPMDSDSRDRMLLCLRVLSGQEEASNQVWLTECRRAFADLTNEKQQREAKEAKAQVRRCVRVCTWRG